jgi:drug/metabolite transporter (DMT)-like permease
MIPTWFLLALAAPLAWSVANYVDKYILSHTEGNGGGSGGLVILSALMSVLFSLGILLIKGYTFVTIDSQLAGMLIFSGIFEGLYIYFYFMALERESASTVVALFQFAPILGLILGYFILKEVPAGIQIIGVLVILFGTLCIILKKGEKFTLKTSVLLLMIISTTFVAIYNILFKFVGEQIPFWNAVFWQYLGIGIVGLIMFVSVPPYRKQVFEMVSFRKGGVTALTAFAEVMNILALLATNAAILLAPIGIVLAIGSIQPAIVLVEGLLIYRLLPTLLNPDEKPSLQFRYILGIILVCVGGILIYQA